MWAIFEPLSIFVSSQWLDSRCLRIDSDSTNSIKWIRDPSLAPWKYILWVLKIDCLKNRLKGWNIVHTSRSVSSVAGQLTKEGMLREAALLNEFP
ncbi:hypothetical protein QUC31_017195 [Theobroma cacao]